MQRNESSQLMRKAHSCLKRQAVQMLDRLRYSSEKALHHQIRDAAMVSAQATGDRTMNKIADYFEVHYTLVSLAIERLAEKCMIARLDPEFSPMIARLDPEFSRLDPEFSPRNA